MFVPSHMCIVAIGNASQNRNGIRDPIRDGGVLTTGNSVVVGAINSRIFGGLGRFRAAFLLRTCLRRTVNLATFFADPFDRIFLAFRI